MSQGITVTRQIHFNHGRRTRKVISEGPPPPEPPPDEVPRGNIPRISRLMALAIKFDGLIQSGHITDQSELARLGHISRARATHVMNLLNLAPDIQEEILFLPRTTQGRDPITERTIRPICGVLDWSKQREMWNNPSE